MGTNLRPRTLSPSRPAKGEDAERAIAKNGEDLKSGSVPSDHWLPEHLEHIASEAIHLTKPTHASRSLGIANAASVAAKNNVDLPPKRNWNARNKHERCHCCSRNICP